MRTLFTILLIATVFLCHAQDSSKVKRTEEYCEVVATQKFMSTKVVITVDYGQEQKLFSSASVVKSDDGKFASFNSVVDALNYMNGLGWEFVNAFPISTSSGPSVYHFYMRRKIHS